MMKEIFKNNLNKYMLLLTVLCCVLIGGIAWSLREPSFKPTIEVLSCICPTGDCSLKIVCGKKNIGNNI